MNDRYQIHDILLPSGTVYRIYDSRVWHELDDRAFDPGAQTIPTHPFWNVTAARNVCAEMNRRYQKVCDDWLDEHEPEVGHYGE